MELQSNVVYFSSCLKAQMLLEGVEFVTCLGRRKGGGGSLCGAFPQSRGEVNRKPHKCTGPLQRSGFQVPGPINICLCSGPGFLLNLYPPGKNYSWQVGRKASKGHEGLPHRHQTGFAIKVELKSSMSRWFMQVSYQD